MYKIREYRKIFQKVEKIIWELDLKHNNQGFKNANKIQKNIIINSISMFNLNIDI